MECYLNIPVQPVLVLCMKWGKAYGPEYVNRLRKGVNRHLSYSHRFICFTDDPTGIEEGIEIFPLPSLGLPPQHHDLRWRKLALLGKDVFGLNIFNKKHLCPACRRKTTPYGEISTNPSPNSLVFEWEIDFETSSTYELENKKYTCPVCMNMELTFEETGCWD